MRKRTTRILAFLLLLLLTAFPVCGEGGDGSGGGGGQDKPLDLLRSNVSDGDTDVDPDVRIELYFSKNVVNLKVREGNKACFSLCDSAGNDVPITVEMGDDQIEPTDEVKRTVTIVPKSPLQTGETYTLTVGKELAAKNGRDVLGSDLKLSFTAGEAKTAARQSYHYASGGNTTTTTTTATTTTTTTTTTTKPGPTKPPITASPRPSATKADDTQTEPSATTNPKTAAGTTTVSAKYEVTVTFSESSSSKQTTTGSQTETGTQTEPETTEETASFAETQTIFNETAPAASLTETVAQITEDTPRNHSRALVIGIPIALAASAAAICIIMRNKKKG